LLNYTGLCLGIHVFQRAQREARDVFWGSHAAPCERKENVQQRFASVGA
jgi:hypothetical protein